MSNTDLIIAERSRDIGDFLVGRLIPFRKKRMVGPFIFIDHMGPSRIGPGAYLDVDQHPHIGLATLTFLLEGEIEHRDSLGTEQVIRPGSVNWMIAGSGVTHTERTPANLRQGQDSTLHGYQIWVALPKGKEEVAPSFHHFAAQDLPHWQEEGAQYRLVAGEAFGHRSPVPVHSELFMVQIDAKEVHHVAVDGALKGELAVCVVKGSVDACGQKVEAGHLLVAKEEGRCDLLLAPGTQVLLFGGQAFPEPREIYWNFVASDKATIEEAKQRWVDKKFPSVPNDSSYVPMPGQKTTPQS